VAAKLDIRIGGKTRQELDELVASLRNEGADLAILEEATNKRFGLPVAEFSAAADEKAIIGLLRNHGTLVACCSA